MILIDTHTHLYSEKFKDDREEMIQRALDGNVKKLFLPNIDQTSIEGMLELEKMYPENCFAMMGLHPCSVGENVGEELAIVQNWLEKRKFVAVGEIGIDLYWDKSFLLQQISAFKKQIEWAKEYNIPIVIHAREAFDEIFKVLDEMNDDRLTGIFHCFTGTEEQAQRVLNYGGFVLGIGGVVTFKKAGLDRTLEKIGIEHLVLETDAPYLAPAPYRGKRNESSYVQFIADKLSDIYQISIEEVAEITSKNALAIFKQNF